MHRTWSASCFAIALSIVSHYRVSLITHGCALTPAESYPPSALPRNPESTWPATEGVICPSQVTLGQHVLVSLPWALNCRYSGTFYDGYKCIPTFFILYSVMSLSMSSMLPIGVLCFYCHFFSETFLNEHSSILNFCIWQQCWHQSTTVRLIKAVYILK